MVIKFDFRHKKLDGDLLLTTACPVECDFCIYSCTASKEPWKWMPEKTIRRVAGEYSKNDIGVRISGGEPFYDLKRLEKCIDILLEYYKPIELLIITSGFFATNKENTEKYIDVIRRKDFDTLVVSMDRFHQRRVPLKNVENIVEVCKKMDVEVALRLSLDSNSFSLIDKVTKLVVKHKLPIEVHGWGVCGRAEKIDSSPLKDEDKTREYFFSKIEELAKKYDSPSDSRYYLTHTAKRSQREYASEFFPTTFPNGNVYACSITMKGCYMGNINKENLLDMIFKFKNTLPGYYMLSNFNCQFLRNFLPEKFNWMCEFCKDNFFINVNNLPEEALGREFVKIKVKSDLNNLFKRLLAKKEAVIPNKYEKELLLSFRLSEKDLWNKKTGLLIKNFLDKLKENKIRFVLSRPLPSCLGKITDGAQPKNCFECRELFTVKNGFIRFCGPLKNIFSQEIKQIENRKQIYKYFISINNRMEVPNICKKCIYYLRKSCNSLCFVK